MRPLARWAFALLAWSARPAAADEPSVELTIDGCIAEDQEIVRSVVAVEVGTRPQLSATRDPIARVRIDCDGGATRIAVDDPVTGKTLVRRIHLGARTPAIRARVLGLAVAELLVASWVELQVNAEPAATPVDAVAPARDREAVTSLVQAMGPLDRAPPQHLFTVSAFAAARRFTDGVHLAVVGADLEVRAGRRLAIAVDVTGERGAADTQLGRIDTLALSLAPRIDRVTTIDRLEVALGGGVRAGMARLSSTPMDAHVVSDTFMRPWAGGFLSARARALATGRWGLGIGIEAGFIALGVAGKVDGQDQPQIEGPWIAAWVGGSIGL